MVGFQPLRPGGFVPFPTLLGIVHNVIEPQEPAPFDILCAQIFRQVRLDAALGGVNFQSCQDSQGLHLLPIPLPFLGGGIFIAGNDASIQCRVGDLTHTGREGIFHRFKPYAPVVGVTDQRLNAGNHQQRSVIHIAKTFAVLEIILANTLIDNGRCNGLDHVTVVIRTAQTLGCQHPVINLQYRHCSHFFSVYQMYEKETSRKQ